MYVDIDRVPRWLNQVHSNTEVLSCGDLTELEGLALVSGRKEQFKVHGRSNGIYVDFLNKITKVR